MPETLIYPKLLGLVMAASMVLAACTNPDAVESQGTITNSLPTTSSSTSSEQSRFYDIEATADLLSPYWVAYSDFQEFAAATDVVFVGQIVGYQTDFVVDGPDPEDRSGAVIIHDGITFNIVDVLSGEEVGKGETLTVAHPVLVNVPGQKDLEMVPIKAEPIDLLRGGIEKSEVGASSPRYLIFATSRGFADQKEAFVLAGPGSVALIDSDGQTILSSGSAPFIDMSGDRNGHGFDMTVEVVRDWIANGRPKISVPEEAKPNPEDDPNKSDD